MPLRTKVLVVGVAVLAATVCQPISLHAQGGSSAPPPSQRFLATRDRLQKFGIWTVRNVTAEAKADLPPRPIPRFAETAGGAHSLAALLPISSQRYSISWGEIPGASGYQWQLWAGQSCRGYLVSAGTTPASQLSATAVDFLRPMSTGSYFWKVRALGDGIVSGDSPWSCGAAFQIGPLDCSGQPLDAPVGLKADGQSCGTFIQTSDNHPVLQWGTVLSASGYAYEVWTGIDCTGTLAASGTTDASTLSASPSYLESGSYFWRVKALGDGSSTCDGSWSGTCSFTVGSPSCGGTYLSNPDITGMTEWHLSGSPYIVSGQLLVEASGTLVIDAGVIVKFASGASAQINGTLAINGTEASRVVFGSLNDSSLCGPSPGGSGNPQPGDWGGVAFAYTSNLTGAYWTVRHATTALAFNQAAGGMLDNLRVSYCQNGISLQYSTVTFTNTRIELCSGAYGVLSDCLGDLSSFTNLDLYETPLSIEGNSQASFTGGTWDGGGATAIGTLDYNTGTPDPSFSGITIQNPPPSTPAAIAIIGQVRGTTHWQGIPFWIQDGRISSTGVVYASDTTLYVGPAIDVQGQFYLGAAGTTTLARDSQGSWQGIIYEAGSSGSVTNATIENAVTGIALNTSGSFSCSNTLIQNCQGQGLSIQAGGTYTFTNLNLTSAPLYVTGNCRPAFNGGTWDGGGATAIGTLDYNTGTPDPSFSGITIQNPPPSTPAAIAIIGQMWGTTHWKGIPFWNQGVSIGSTGIVYASDTTIYSQGAYIGVQGRLYFGAAGVTTTATDFNGTGWPGILFESGSSGIISNATISRASSAITVATSGGVLLAGDVIASSQEGLVTQSDGAPLVERTVFAADNGVSVSVQGSSAPDLGGGALGSPGYNTILGANFAVQNLSASPVSARFNWWGCAAEAEMDAGLPNITTIYDKADDSSLGIVDYSGWLGSKNRSIRASRQNNDLLLTWPQEPTGALTIFRGTDPAQMTSVGTTTGGSWRDSGAITDPSPLIFYRVDGPCQ